MSNKYWSLFRTTLVLAATYLSVTSFPKLTFLVIVYSLFLFCQLFPKVGGIVTRFILVILTFFSINTLIGFIGWGLGFNVDPHFLTIFYGVLVASLSLVYTPKWSRDFYELHHEELIALAAGIVIFFAAYAPLLHSHSPIILERVAASGGDNISHIAIINAVSEHQGYHQGQGIGPYPQGWHLNVSILRNLYYATFHSASLGNQLYLYELVSDAGLGLLVYLFVLVGLKFSSFYRDKGRDHIIQLIVVLGVAALLFMGPLFGLFAIGFQTFISSLYLFIAEILLLMIALELSNKHQQKILFVLGALFASAIAYVWLLLWPIALAILLLSLVRCYGINRVVLFNHWKLFSLLAFIYLLAIGQIFFQVAYSSSLTADQNGFILEPNNFLLFDLLAISLIAYRFLGQRKSVIKDATIGSALFCLLILIYQLITIHGPRYFYFKATYIFVILAGLLVVPALVLIFNHILNNIGDYSSFFIVLLFLSTSSLVWVERSSYFNKYIQEKPYGLSIELADAILTIDNKNPADGGRTIAVGSCNREQDIVAMRMASALTSSQNSGQTKVASAQVSSPERTKTFAAIKKYLKTQPYLIVLSTDYGTQRALTNYLGSQASKIRFVNLDYGHTSKTFSICPDFLR